jgi:hypothetical protein
MIGADAILVIGGFSVAALVIAAIATLKGWHGWLELKKMEVAQAGYQCQRDSASPPPLAGGRIEIADLKERVRKLEAIANGIDL